MARLSHLFLLASDLAAQRRLFVDLLGLEVLAEYPGYVRVGGRGGFDIGIEEGEPGPPNAVEITIEVPDVDAAYARLAEAGVAVEGPPALQEWGARHAWFRDGDGRRMSVFVRT
jgi:catechol 2,3-dioxygenase-like lactoylglutathione lyase family enzyme